MENNWPQVKLGEYCSKIGSGATPRGGSSVYKDTGEICLVRSQNIYNEGFKRGGLVFIDEGAADKLKNVILESNDILLNITGDSVARVCLVDNSILPARVNQHVIIIRPKTAEFDARFIRYYLTTPYAQALLLNLASAGATRNALTKSMIENFETPKPPLDIQVAIAEKLEALEHKVTSNTQINQTLEQMAQALFKSWFVDFDPVFDNALAAGTNVSDFPEALQQRAELRKQAQQLPDFKALPDDIRALCPSEFEQTEEPHFGIFGWIPKGWKVSELSEFIKFANGKAKKHSSDGSYPIYGANGIIGNTDEVKFKNAVIVGRVGAYCGAIEYCRSDFWSSDNTIVATSKLSEEQIPHILYLLKHLDLNQYAGGAAQPLLNQTTLNKLKIPFAGIDSMMQFNEIVDALLVKQIKNIEQTTKLNEIRNILLPKLISGELTIPDSIKTENIVNHQQPKEALSNHA
ncbi:MAG: type I restriction enzyme S subunit [Colwellia sp.]|jgi:type I restriction enzyme S subunit